MFVLKICSSVPTNAIITICHLDFVTAIISSILVLLLGLASLYLFTNYKQRYVLCSTKIVGNTLEKCFIDIKLKKEYTLDKHYHYVRNVIIYKIHDVYNKN